MPTEKWDDHLTKRETERTPEEAELFAAASMHFAQVAEDLNLGAELAAIRKQAGFSQSDLAERTGVDQADISRIERGIGNPTLHTLTRIGDAVGHELHWVAPRARS